MSLNIKDRNAHQLAKRIAVETGETLTRVVVESLRERWDRMQREKRSRASVEELLEIGRRCASHLKGPPIDHAEMLYDERGLPK